MNFKEMVKNGSNVFELPLRVVFYARVSTGYDTQVSSIMNQVDFFRSFFLLLHFLVSLKQ